MDAAEQDRLRQEVESAFRTVPYPGGERIVYDNSGTHPDCNAVKAIFVATHWHDISPQAVIRYPEALSAFTPESFRFFLPAFLLACIEHYDEADVLPGNLISGFQTRRDPHDQGRLQARLDALSPDQRRAVARVIEFLQREHGEDFLTGSLEAALSNLE